MDGLLLNHFLALTLDMEGDGSLIVTVQVDQPLAICATGSHYVPGFDKISLYLKDAKMPGPWITFHDLSIYTWHIFIGCKGIQQLKHNPACDGGYTGKYGTGALKSAPL